jgi:Transcriptional regulator containing PAS, AAA-type ATPase, and DNA-binding domains
MQELLKTALRLSQVDSTVLLLGESGVGKEVIATTIHARSHRKEGPFIAVNCGAIPADLLESELFGYEKGAFTGANREGKSGMFELANGGTLFLDEIGDLPKDFQVKLLRAIQEREIMRVGGSKPRPINVRIIAATNHDLENLVREGKFREDLYFRLNVVPLDIPPLRERKEDIIPLIYSFKNKFSKAYEINKDIMPEVYDILLQYQWPGNVRELENVIERLMVTTTGDTIGINDIPKHLINYTPDNHPEIKVQGIIPLKEAVNTVERQLITNALKQFGSTYKAARVLQVDQSTIVRKANKLNISHKDT